VRAQEEGRPQQGGADGVAVDRQALRGEPRDGFLARPKELPVFIGEIQVAIQPDARQVGVVKDAVGADQLVVHARERDRRQEGQGAQGEEEPEEPLRSPADDIPQAQAHVHGKPCPPPCDQGER